MGVLNVTNSTVTTVDTFIRVWNSRIFMWAMNAPVPSCVSSTSTTSQPPEGRRSIRSSVESGERPGNSRNKNWRRALLDLDIHARRTEAMVVSFSVLHAFRRAIIRASEVAVSSSEDVAGLLSIAQYTGVCFRMSGSCRTTASSRPTSLQASEQAKKRDWRSSSEG